MPFDTSLNQTRRYFLQLCPLALGSMALASLKGAESGRPDPIASANPLAPKPPGFPARAKAVISLHMAGGPSQLDLFDYKPTLKQYDGKQCPQSLLEGKRFAFIRGVPTLLATPFQFEQHGQSGSWISELLPKLSSVADDLCVVRSMHTDQFNHAPAQLFLHTGNPRLGYASMGAWVTYGLGSENQNLPGYIALLSGGQVPSAGRSVWGSGFLPSVYQGVQCRTRGEPVLYIQDPPGISPEMRRITLNHINSVNRLHYEQVGNPQILDRIGQFELAFRMQTAVPEVMDIGKEPGAVHEMYGTELGAVSFANNCLLARRLVESGVRFVQLFHWGWDHHGNNEKTDIRYDLPEKVRSVDRPIAALISDLKRRGLLDETLIVWGGEFGRTPMRENRDGVYAGYVGRDHHPHGFTMWMAGGGVNAGLNYGSTDEIGYYASEKKVSVRDLQATILHLLGLDPFRLTYRFQGLDQRLIGPTDEAKVVGDLLA